MLNRLASRAAALEPSEEALEVEALHPGFISRARSALPVGLVITGGVMAVLWMALICWGVIWLVFES